MFRFIVRDDDMESSFLALSEQLPASIGDHIIHIPVQRGSGSILSIFLEPGLYLRYSKLSYKEETLFLRLPKQAESETIFGLRFFITPALLQTGSPFSGQYVSVENTNKILLSSNNTRLVTHIPKAAAVHTVELFFSRDWLSTQRESPEEKTDYFGEMLKNEGSHPVVTRSYRPEEEELLGDIARELNKPDKNRLALRSRCLTLMAGMLDRLPTQNTGMQPSGHYFQLVKRVGQQLLDSLEDMPPSQKELARGVALSESTLKRYFKSVYGRTMYEYYLEKKMEHARHLIRDKKASVSETACLLGYEKTSSFIRTFKKYCHILPGALK